MARINPVYISTLSNPVPVPSSISNRPEQNLIAPEAEIETNRNRFISRTIESGGYGAEEINESGVITGAARRSGGSNVGGVVGFDKKEEMFLPFKTQSEQEEYVEQLPKGVGDKVYDYLGKSLSLNPFVMSFNLADKITGGKATETLDRLGETKVGKGFRNVRDSGKRFLNKIFSDRRLKTNIKLIGKSEQGYNIYSFKFIDPSYGEGIYQGVIADEMPEQVISKNEDGYNMVDYNMIDVEFKKIDEYSRITKTNNKNMGKIIAKSGVELSTPARCRPAGKRVMTSRDMTIKSDLSVDNIMYKGNANLLAQR